MPIQILIKKKNANSKKKKIMNIKTHMASEFSFFLSSIVISKGSDSQKKKKISNP